MRSSLSSSTARAGLRRAFGLTLSIALLSAGNVSPGAGDTSSGSESGTTARPPAKTEAGTASFYAGEYHGKPTASGEVFDMHQFTAAHPSLAFGTRVKVTNLDNNRAVVVRINDRGPYVKDRVIDLSLAAAEELRMVQRGLARVKLEVVN